MTKYGGGKDLGMRLDQGYVLYMALCMQQSAWVAFWARKVSSDLFILIILWAVSFKV